MLVIVGQGQWRALLVVRGRIRRLESREVNENVPSGFMTFETWPNIGLISNGHSKRAVLLCVLSIKFHAIFLILTAD